MQFSKVGKLEAGFEQVLFDKTFWNFLIIVVKCK